MANRRFIDFPIAATVGNNDIVLIWQDGLNKQTTKATLLQGSPQSLAGLTDVDIAALTNGQILQYNSTTSKWENVDRTDINLSELGDVTIVAPANGQVLVYNSSTSKWENSSAGYVPYTGAVTTVNLGAQSILAGSFVKAGGTAAQFLKANGSVDSTAYGTGTVTSVALTMPTAFSVAGSPITTAGTLAVTATGTTSQYIRGDGSLASFPALTGFVPYTGATADVNLGTHDLAAERGTFTNNGSSDTLTVNHTSGSGYGIIVTKGGANEALYVSKTSGSGNAMTVVGGRTSLVDLALSSVTNTAGDFLTLSGGVVHKRTAAQTLTDIGGQAALTNPVTGTGTTNYLPKFTGSTTIGNSNLINDASGNLGLGVTPSAWATVSPVFQIGTASLYGYNNSLSLSSNAYYNAGDKYIQTGFATQYYQSSGIHAWYNAPSGTAGNAITFTQAMTLTAAGRLLINTPSESTFQLDVNGTGRFSQRIQGQEFFSVGSLNDTDGSFLIDHSGVQTWKIGITNNNTSTFSIGNDNGGAFATKVINIINSGNVGIGTTNPNAPLHLVNSSNGFIQRFAGGTSSAITGGIFAEIGRNFASIGTISNHGFNIFTNDNDRLVITSGGNVLIGTETDNGAKLQVNGGITVAGTSALADNELRIRTIGDANHAIKNNATINGPLSYGYLGSGLGWTEGSSAQIALMNVRGNVLIGTTSDGSSKLRIVGLPTSSAGLSSGDVYNLSGVLMIA
jgi:hypothetical protein